MEMRIMRDKSLVTKIIASTCGIVLILLLAHSLFVITFERNLVNTFIEKYQQEVDQSLIHWEQAEKDTLRRNIESTAGLLNSAGAKLLSSNERDTIKEMLPTYMKPAEIQAIQFWDAAGKPIAAIWRLTTITVGDVVPDALKIQTLRSLQSDCLSQEKMVGKLAVYYTENGIMEAIRKTKDAAGLFYNSAYSQMRWAIVIQIIGAFVIFVILFISLRLLLRTVVLKPLLVVANVARRLLDFDLTINVHTKKRDEIGKLLTAIDETVTSFRHVVGQVQRSGIQVTSSSTELAATAKQQEVTVRNQMESTNKVVKSVQEISEVAAHLTTTMRHVASMLDETTGFASSGQTDLTRMKDAMQHMENASKSVSRRLQTINEKAENITTIVTTINKVADQTNLLSLNAAIEAEKAGEYGRGFTVVAREIRRLADQTALATLDIEHMVAEMRSAMSAGVMEMDKFISEVRRGAEDVGKIGAQLTNIIEQVQALSPSFAEVNTSMEQQSRHTKEITAAMMQLSEEMTQTTESLRESFMAIGQLNEAVRGLQDEVSRFKVN